MIFLSVEINFFSVISLSVTRGKEEHFFIFIIFFIILLLILLNQDFVQGF